MKLELFCLVLRVMLSSHLWLFRDVFENFYFDNTETGSPLSIIQMC